MMGTLGTLFSTDFCTHFCFMLYYRLSLLTTSITISVLLGGSWGDHPEGAGPPTLTVLGCWGQPQAAVSMDVVSAPLHGPAPSGCCEYSCTLRFVKIHVFLTYLQSFYIVAGFITPVFMAGIRSPGGIRTKPPATTRVPPWPPVVTLPIRMKQEEEGGTLVANPLQWGSSPPSKWNRLRRWCLPPGWVTHFLWFYPFLSQVPYLRVCVQYSITHLNTSIPISFQALVGEIALISPSIFQDLHLDASLLAPGDQPEELPPQNIVPEEELEEELARDPEVPSLPPGSLETVVSTLYGYTVQCDLTHCLPILLRRPPPQNCVLHCRHPSLRMILPIGCREWWGGHPSRWSGRRRRRGMKRRRT